MLAAPSPPPTRAPPPTNTKTLNTFFKWLDDNDDKVIKDEYN
jgi:hypothetical protein